MLGDWVLKVFTFHYPHERQASGTLYAMLADTQKKHNIISPLILFDYSHKLTHPAALRLAHFKR
jgi:hypothetical protein